MLTSETLLQLIANLQQDTTIAYARHALLEFARTSTRARLALLFLQEEEREELCLIEQSGRRPQYGRDKLKTNPVAVENPRQLPLNGRFGVALRLQEPQQIRDIHTDPLALPAEKYWTWRGGEVVLCAIGAEQGRRQPTGLLVLCYAEGAKLSSAEIKNLITASIFLVCRALLSAYLVPEQPKRHGKGAQPPTKAHTLSYVQPVSEPRYTRVDVEAAVELERRRIAHDLHDGSAQRIAHILHKLELIERLFVQQPEVALREIGRTHVLLEETLEELRHIISSLLPIEVEKQGLEAALQTLLYELRQKEPGVQIVLEIDALNLLPLRLETPIFRFIQECLSNIHKHAQASRVEIRAYTSQGALFIDVSDNGRGFNTLQWLRMEHGETPQQVGLLAMRERIQQVGGTWTIQSQPGEGTTVRARFSLSDQGALLTSREREVLRLLIEGYTNRAIAARLSVSIETIKSHVRHIMLKLQAKDRTQAAVIATRQQRL